MNIGTAFDFEPLPDGNGLVEFFGNDGQAINKRIVTPNLICRIPLVAALLGVALGEGLEVARKIMQMLNTPN